ncbi:MAG: CDP-alcohol phosphatidyltransferase, partial [Deltaproteobacteria bacterium]|nr:CDP-alcohol phosphatidyltransferase [Deltaproteobacteria bacterium]
MSEIDRQSTTDDIDHENVPTSKSRKNMLGFLRDKANLLTMVGLVSSVVGIYFAIEGSFEAAMIAMLWAIFFDWFDGPVARRTKGRDKSLGEFGAALDSLVDIVSFGVFPAIVLLSYGEFSPWFLPGAVALVAAGVLRLSYFNVFGLEGGSTYVGLSLDINSFAFTFVFLFERLVDRDVFQWGIYAMSMVLAALNVSSMRS